MITFYDIPSKLPEKAWSPNTFKVRIALNYKRVPYKTEWVEYPDIEPVLKKLGGAPTGKKPDGSDFYTLPAIHDSTTGRVITESENIVAYLDETYPDTPKLFPILPGGGSTRAAIATLEHVFMASLLPLFPLLASPVCSILNPPSERYLRRSREAVWGKLEDIAPPGPIRDGIWKEAREGLNRLAGFYDKNGEGKLFFFGDTFSFADAVAVGYVTCLKVTLGAESEDWQTLTSWNNGRWVKLIEATKELLVVEN